MIASPGSIVNDHPKLDAQARPEVHCVSAALSVVLKKAGLRGGGKCRQLGQRRERDVDR